MDATIRATCPNCQTGLKIPAKWAGQAVKCKKCGAVVRTKAADAADPAAPLPLPADEPSPFAGMENTASPRYNPFDPETGGAAPPAPLPSGGGRGGGPARAGPRSE